MQVTKCCPEEHVLDLTESAHPLCSFGDDANLQRTLEEVTGLDLTMKVEQQEIQINIKFSDVGMTKCSKGAADFSTLNGNKGELMFKHVILGSPVTSWVTADGHLVKAFGPGHQLRLNQFCVDQTTTGLLGALSCPPCSQVEAICQTGSPCRSIRVSTSAVPMDRPWYSTMRDRRSVEQDQLESLETLQKWKTTCQIALQNWKTEHQNLAPGQSTTIKSTTGQKSTNGY